MRKYRAALLDRVDSHWVAMGTDNWEAMEKHVTKSMYLSYLYNLYIYIYNVYIAYFYLYIYNTCTYIIYHLNIYIYQLSIINCTSHLGAKDNSVTYMGVSIIGSPIKTENSY